MRNLLLVVLALIAVFSVGLNIVLAYKVNYLRAARMADKEIAQTLVTSAVRAASEIQKEVDERDNQIKSLEDKIEIAIDVVEKLEDKIIGYENDIHANSHIHNKLYELLSQRRIVKKVWSSDILEFYDINSMSIEEIHDIFGYAATLN